MSPIDPLALTFLRIQKHRILGQPLRRRIRQPCIGFRVRIRNCREADRNQMIEPQKKDTITVTIKKSYLYAALAVVLAFGSGLGVSWLSSRSTTPVPEDSNQSALAGGQRSVVQIGLEGRPSLGPPDARVTIVEFTDYECPFCSRHFQDTMPQLLRKYEDTIRYVILNFPISRIHPSAQHAAEAAECAHDQGKFWEYHDTLFQNQEALDVGSLKIYAENIGLDAEAFSGCLDTGAKTQLVLGHIQDGLGYGVSGTPTFFINGRILVGARQFGIFQSMIDEALSE